jgi:hypothetical protein
MSSLASLSRDRGPGVKANKRRASQSRRRPSPRPRKRTVPYPIQKDRCGGRAEARKRGTSEFGLTVFIGMDTCGGSDGGYGNACCCHLSSGGLGDLSGMVAVEISCEMQSRCESSVDLGAVHPSAAASAVSTATPLSRDLGGFYVFRVRVLQAVDRHSRKHLHRQSRQPPRQH